MLWDNKGGVVCLQVLLKLPVPKEDKNRKGNSNGSQVIIKMLKLSALVVAIILLLTVTIPVYGFDPPEQDTTANATDTIIWHGDTANISVTHDSDLTITGLNDSINDFTDRLAGFLYLVPLLAISILAFWKENTFLFMLAFGFAWLTGLNAPDMLDGNTETTTLGLTLGLTIIGYGLFCAVMVFRLMFWENKE